MGILSSYIDKYIDQKQKIIITYNDLIQNNLNPNLNQDITYTNYTRNIRKDSDKHCLDIVDEVGEKTILMVIEKAVFPLVKGNIYKKTFTCKHDINNIVFENIYYDKSVYIKKQPARKYVLFFEYHCNYIIGIEMGIIIMNDGNVLIDPEYL